MKKKIKKFILYLKSDYRHLICIIFSIFVLVFGIAYFKYAVPRLVESVRDLISCIIFYFCELFDIECPFFVTINNYTKMPFKMPFNLPNNKEEFIVFWNLYWDVFFTGENFSLYMRDISIKLTILSKILLILIPIIAIAAIITSSANKSNNDYDKDSKELLWWKNTFEKKIYYPVKKWIISFIDFLKQNKFYSRFWTFMCLYSFNGFTIIIEALAFYLFFVSAFDLFTIYIQFKKLLMDLSVVFSFVPLVIWIIIIWLLFNKWRKNVGYDNLNHMERMNRGFINERPIVLMLCGTMGKKKTTIITDMAISQEIIFRNKAFEKILEQDLKFPYFPWINLENEIKIAMENHKIYNLASCSVWIKECKSMFEYYNNNDKQTVKSIIRNLKKQGYPFNTLMFGYDYNKYPIKYDSKLDVEYIWDVLEKYTKLYFIYIIQSSLILSNYSIRVDSHLMDLGNFPLWNHDLFKKDPLLSEAYSRHAHILDFDSLRLGRKILEDNPMSDSFEFGVVNLTEIGKERKNNIELQGIKAKDESTNQKNDKFNEWLKMCRHSATVDNFPFIKVITDEQRPESWGADARDLLEVVHINESSEKRLSMPFFHLEDLLIQLFLEYFNNKYYDYRYLRGDNTLWMYLLHGFVGKLNKYYQGIFNTFGYYEMDLTVESGTDIGLDNPGLDRNYYLMFKKIYSKRFSTDCYSDFFNKKSLRSSVGINDVPEFESEKASLNELTQENSFFIKDITELMNPNNEDKK